MNIVYEYSHLGGAEILKVRYPHIEEEIREVISQVKAERIKESREKTKQGQFLFAPISMNTQFRALFNARGYTEIRDTYTIQIPGYQVTISRPSPKDVLRGILWGTTGVRY